MKDYILLLGAGGHCVSVIDSILSQDIFSIYGISDVKERLGTTVLDIPVTISDDDLNKIFNLGIKNAFVTVGSVGDCTVRINLYNKLKAIGFSIPYIIDSTACVSKIVQIGDGVFIGKHAIVNAETKIEEMAIVNTSAIVEHGCLIKSYAHIAPASVLLGNVSIGSKTHIGAASTVLQGITIANDVMIGACSFVNNNITKQGTYFGIPCKQMS